MAASRLQLVLWTVAVRPHMTDPTLHRLLSLTVAVAVAVVYHEELPPSRKLCCHRCQLGYLVNLFIC